MLEFLLSDPIFLAPLAYWFFPQIFTKCSLFTLFAQGSLTSQINQEPESLSQGHFLTKPVLRYVPWPYLFKKMLLEASEEWIGLSGARGRDSGDPCSNLGRRLYYKSRVEATLRRQWGRSLMMMHVTRLGQQELRKSLLLQVSLHIRDLQDIHWWKPQWQIGSRGVQLQVFSLEVVDEIIGMNEATWRED